MKPTLLKVLQGVTASFRGRGRVDPAGGLVTYSNEPDARQYPKYIYDCHEIEGEVEVCVDWDEIVCAARNALLNKSGTAKRGPIHCRVIRKAIVAGSQRTE